MSTISASTTSTTAYKVTADTTGTLVLQTGATPTTALTITSGQQIGVGTATPVTAVNRNVTISTASGGAGLSLQDTGVSSKFELIAGAGGVNAFGIYDLSASAYRLNLNSTGNLCVGSSTAGSYRLFIKDSTAKATTTGYPFAISSSDGSNPFDLVFERWGSGYYKIQAVEQGVGYRPLVLQSDGGGLLVGGTTSRYGLFQIADISISTKTATVAMLPGDPSFSVGFRNGPSGNTAGTEIGRLAAAYQDTDIGWMSFTRSGGASCQDIRVVAGSVGVYLTNGGSSWASLSDERTKTDLKPIVDAAQKVCTLRAVTGRYNSDNEDVSRSFLIAQDVQAVLPEAVSEHAAEGEDATYLGLSYTDVIPLLVAAIKELKAEIDTLKGQA